MSDPFAEAAWMLRQRGAIEFADALDKEVATLHITIERLTKERDEMRIVRTKFDDLLRAHGILESAHREKRLRAEAAETELAKARNDVLEADWQRIDDALFSSADLIRSLCRDEVGDTAAAELDFVRRALKGGKS